MFLDLIHGLICALYKLLQVFFRTWFMNSNPDRYSKRVVLVAGILAKDRAFLHQQPCASRSRRDIGTFEPQHEFVPAKTGNQIGGADIVLKNTGQGEAQNTAGLAMQGRRYDKGCNSA